MTEEQLNTITVEDGEQSAVKISGEIPFSELETHRNAALKHIGKDVKLDGFRPGHVPEKILTEKVGEMAILTEMAERALSSVYPEIVKAHKLDVVGYPKINITKIAAGNPLGFTAEVAIMPSVNLPDYKTTAREANKEQESPEVTEEEVQKQVEDILRQKVAYERLQEKAKQKEEADANKKDLGGATELPTPETVEKGGEKEEAGEEDPSKLPLPELTDEYVKTLGQPGQFESVDDFKAKIKEHLSIEKAREVASRHRAKITDSIVAVTDITLPQVMIDAEINQMFAQMEEDLKRAQLNMDDYLTHSKKTREDLKKEWVPAAEKRAKLQLILNEIGKVEKIELDTGKVDHEVSHLLEHYKDADEARVRIYVESIMQNEEVLKMLENLK